MSDNMNFIPTELVWVTLYPSFIRVYAAVEDAKQLMDSGQAIYRGLSKAEEREHDEQLKKAYDEN